MTASTAPAPALDADLVRAGLGGDRAALRALFDRHQHDVVAYCVLCANGDRERARDLAQETFARAFAALGRLAQPDRFRGFLFTVAANVCRTRGSQDGRRRALEVAALEADAPAPPAEEPLLRERRIAVVQRVLAQIRDETVRAIALLKYGEPEHTTREIAARLSIPHGTVTVKLMRFRAAARRELLRALVLEEVA